MSEVRVVAILVAKKELINEVESILQQIIEPSRTELGNVQYDLHEDTETKGTFIFFERWASSEALDKHNNTAHFKHFVQQIDGKLASLDIKVLRHIA